jgi:hypothetical protein
VIAVYWRLQESKRVNTLCKGNAFKGLILMKSNASLLLQGSWLWWWKDSIDRAFMRKYGDDLPPMSASMKGAGGGMQGSGAGRPTCHVAHVTRKHRSIPAL